MKVTIATLAIFATTTDAFQSGGRAPNSSSLNAVAEKLEKTFSSRPAGKSFDLIAYFAICKTTCTNRSYNNFSFPSYIVITHIIQRIPILIHSSSAHFRELFYLSFCYDVCACIFICYIMHINA